MRFGLSQDEVALLLGAVSGSEVSRHENFKQMPSLKTAFGYEVIFGAAIRDLFVGDFHKVEEEVKERAQELASRILVPGEGTQGKMKRDLFSRILEW